MSTLAKKLIGESESNSPDKMKSGRETRVYKITSRPDHLDQIEHMFKWMNMTAGGHSGSMLLSIDGDGAARVKIEKEGGELASPPDEFQPDHNGKPEFKVCMDSLNEPKMIIEAFKPVKCWVCPHCRQEIHEKHTFMEGKQEFHSDCKGALLRPPYDWTGVDPKWRALLEPKQ